MKFNDSEHFTLMESIRSAMVNETAEEINDRENEEQSSEQQMLTENVDSFYENFDVLIGALPPEKARTVVGILNEAIDLVLFEMNAAAEMRIARQKSAALARVAGKGKSGAVMRGTIAQKAGQTPTQLARQEKLLKSGKKLPPSQAQAIAKAALGG